MTFSGCFWHLCLLRCSAFSFDPPIVPEALSLHDEIAKVRRDAVHRRSADTRRQLEQVAKRLPSNYRTVGVRVYNPVRPLWKLQLAWGCQLALCLFLIWRHPPP